MAKLDTRVVLTHSEIEEHKKKGYSNDLFIDHGNGPEYFGIIGDESRDALESINKHICCIPDFAKALELFNKIQNAESIDVEDVGKLSEQFTKQMELINNKLNE